MRILMLGWEFPPFISGGLGTACYGLTRALDSHGHEVTFVLPRPVEESHASHVRLVSPEAPRAAGAPDAVAVGNGAEPGAEGVGGGARSEVRVREEFERLKFLGVPASLPSVYGEFTQEIPGGEETLRRLREERVDAPGSAPASDLREAFDAAGVSVEQAGLGSGTLTRGGDDYSGDVMTAAARYAALVVSTCRDERFDVVHAHDWMTYPAGLAIARLTGTPLVVHVHSTEFDRSGTNVNQAIYDIERRGMHGAARVICVSYLTRSICLSRYGVEPSKVKVVYNGVEASEPLGQLSRVRSKDKIVLFLGRLTMQKGPEYFIEAARLVLRKMDDVKFVVAGSGDMARRMIELAAAHGIGHKVLFTGFLRGRDVSRVFEMADCYVMPSVSEPFGIAPLEAICHNTPVIISKQSGVSEVLTHALKVDFWDVREMADKILAVLRHPPLSQTLRDHGAFEVRGLTWDGAAEKCEKVYLEAGAGSGGGAGGGPGTGVGAGVASRA